MRFNPDNSPEKQAAYQGRVESMDDERLYLETKDKVWFSAYASNNPRSCFHWQADCCRAECARRGKEELAEQAYQYVANG